MEPLILLIIIITVLFIIEGIILFTIDEKIKDIEYDNMLLKANIKTLKATNVIITDELVQNRDSINKIHRKVIPKDGK